MQRPSNPSNIKIQMNNFTLNLQTLLSKDQEKLPTTYRKNTKTQRVKTQHYDFSPLKVKEKTKEKNLPQKQKSKKEDFHENQIKAKSKTQKVNNQEKREQQAILKKVKKTEHLNTQQRSKSRKQKSSRLQRHFKEYDHVIESARLRTSPSIQFFNQNFNSESISKSASRSRSKSFKKKQSKNPHHTKSRTKSTFSTINNQKLHSRKSTQKIVKKDKQPNRNQENQLERSEQKTKKNIRKPSKSRQRKSIDNFNKTIKKSKSRERIYTQVSQRHPFNDRDVKNLYSGNFNHHGYDEQKLQKSHKKSKSHHNRQQSQNLMSHSQENGVVLGPKFASNKINEKQKQKPNNKNKTKKMSNTLSATNIQKNLKTKKMDLLKKQTIQKVKKQKSNIKQKTSMSSQFNFYQSTITNANDKKKLTESDLQNYFEKSTNRKSKKLKTEANNLEDHFQSHGLSSMKKARKQQEEGLIDRAFKKKKMKNIVQKLFDKDGKQEEKQVYQTKIKIKARKNVENQQTSKNDNKLQTEKTDLIFQLPRRVKREKNLTIQTTFKLDERNDINFDDISKILEKRRRTEESMSEHSRNSICRSQKSIKEEIMEGNFVKIQNNYVREEDDQRQEEIRRLKTNELQDSDEQEQEEDENQCQEQEEAYYQQIKSHQRHYENHHLSKKHQSSSQQQQDEYDESQESQKEQAIQGRQKQLLRKSSKVEIYTSSDIGKSQQSQKQDVYSQLNQKQQQQQQGNSMQQKENERQLQQLQQLNEKLLGYCQHKTQQHQNSKDRQQQKCNYNKNQYINKFNPKSSNSLPEQKVSKKQFIKIKKVNQTAEHFHQYKSFRSFNLISQGERQKISQKNNNNNKVNSVPHSPLAYGIQNKQKVISSLNKPRKSVDEQFRIAKTLSNKKLLQELELQQTLQRIQKSVQSSLIYQASEYQLLSTSRDGMKNQCKDLIREEQKHQLTTKNHKTIEQLQQQLLLEIMANENVQGSGVGNRGLQDGRKLAAQKEDQNGKDNDNENEHDGLKVSVKMTINTEIQQQKQDSPLLSENQFKRSSSPINIFDQLDYLSIKNTNHLNNQKQKQKQKPLISIKPFMHLQKPLQSNDDQSSELQLYQSSEEKNSLDVRRGEYSQMSLEFEKQMDDYLKDANDKSSIMMVGQKGLNKKSTATTTKINHSQEEQIHKNIDLLDDRSSDEFFYYQSIKRQQQQSIIINKPAQANKINRNQPRQKVTDANNDDQQQQQSHCELIQAQLTEHIFKELLKEFIFFLTQHQAILHRFLIYCSRVNVVDDRLDAQNQNKQYKSEQILLQKQQQKKKKPIFDPFEALDDDRHHDVNELQIGKINSQNNNRQVNEHQFLNYLQSKIYATNDYVMNLAYELFNFVKTSPEHSSIFLTNINKSFGLKPLKTLRWMRKAYNDNNNDQQQQQDEDQEAIDKNSQHSRGQCQNQKDKQSNSQQQSEQISNLSQNQQLQAVFSPILLADFDAQQNEIIFQQINQEQYYLNHAVYAALNEISDCYRPYGENGPPVIPKQNAILNTSVPTLQPKILSRLQKILSLRMGRTQFHPDEQPQKIIPQSYKKMDEMIVQEEHEKWNERGLEDLKFEGVYYLAMPIVDFVINQEVMEIFRLVYG